MELTVFIPTKNNHQNLDKLIVSLKPLKPTFVFVDFGSTDGSVDTCLKYGKVHRFNESKDRSRSLNTVYADCATKWAMFMKPNETLIQGHEQILKATKLAYYLPVVQETIVNKEIRLWQKVAPAKFVNPVYEHVETNTTDELASVVYSTGSMDADYCLSLIQEWKINSPMAPEPYYYHACILLMQQKYEDFLKVSEHYMFIANNKNSMASVMNRYYYAMIKLLSQSTIKPTLQNLTLCLSVKPLMAEFWCLLGDVYYHRLRKFDVAKEFYENAILLGGRRLKTDKWPMDIAKYKDYPEKMIISCDKIINSKAFYIKSSAST